MNAAAKPRVSRVQLRHDADQAPGGVRERGSLVFEPELHWFYNYSAGDLGLRAASIEPTIRGGANEQRGDAEDVRVNNATRQKPVWRAIGALDYDSQMALKYEHTIESPGFRARWAEFGEHCAIIVRHTLGEQGAANLARRRRAKETAEESRTAISFEIVQARAMLVKAVRAYRAAIRAGKAEVREHNRVMLDRKMGRAG